VKCPGVDGAYKHCWQWDGGGGGGLTVVLGGGRTVVGGTTDGTVGSNDGLGVGGGMIETEAGIVRTGMLDGTIVFGPMVITMMLDGISS
jgi:hypothetical protein